MSGPATRATWSEANRDYLGASLRRVCGLLEGTGEVGEALLVGEPEVPPALVSTAELFGLSSFERDVLLLTAGVELDGDLAALCAQRPEARGGWPTFALALAALPDPHWSALTVSAPLRHWRLVELGRGEGLTTRPLRIDERILHHLLGISPLDERLQGLLQAVAGPGTVAESHRRLARQVLESWTVPGDDGWPVVQLLGADRSGKAAVASLACAELGAPLMRLDATELPGDDAGRNLLALLWDREAFLTGAVLLVDCDGLEKDQLLRLPPFVRRLRAPVLVAASEPLEVRSTVVHLDVAKPAGAEARKLWQAELGAAWSALNGEGEAVLGQFALDLDGIRSVSARVRRQSEGGDADVGSLLWRACRGQARPRLDGLAQRVEARAAWEDLILPSQQLTILRELALHLAHRATVYERWGFERQSARGLGFSALFAGESGTGKTMAGEVLARHLDLDLYRIDLSQVVSKYIGETEKKLSQVFGGAEDGGAILLFDEADALFGKRSEVKDSHDRYANIEVSYLLQRMEDYRGLAILTTNQKSALDRAFLRRLRFIVSFPFPDESQREEIWRRVFPADAPVGDLDFVRLARLDLAGGNIRNIAMNAAFLAADAGESVAMCHVVAAARTEYAKLGKPLAESEVRRLTTERSRA